MIEGTPRRERILGSIACLCILAVLAGVVAGYKQLFIPVIPVSVEAPRSGLLMEPGADVTLRDVIVGKVRRVQSVDNHVVLDVAIYADEASHVPENVVSSIVAPTIFGEKYVQLDAPSQFSSTPVRPGAVIRASYVPTEANSLLDNLNILLTSIDVAKLGSAMGALSTALQGRGERLGAMLVRLNRYVRDINPSIPALNHDLERSADVASVYAQATPDLVHVLDNLAVTSRTLVDERSALPGLLSSIIDVSTHAKTLLDDNATNLKRAAAVLRPTTGLLAQYSPMFPCLFATLNEERLDMSKAIGYQYPGLHILGTLLPGSDPYKYPRDLPKIVPATPPSCFGGPLSLPETPSPHVVFEDGTNNFVPSDAVTLRPGVPVARPLPPPVSNADSSRNGGHPLGTVTGADRQPGGPWGMSRDGGRDPSLLGLLGAERGPGR